MRSFLVLVHRWLGLSIAAFLFIAGLTGAVIAWEHELDVWLNPDFFGANSDAEPLPALELARRVEQSDARVGVGYVPLAIERGRALIVRVYPRVDPVTGRPFVLDFDQVAIDPGSGVVQGKRLWGRASLSRLQLVPFLYRLHFTLHLPTANRVDLGTLLMGSVALIWALDGIVALWISFPSRKTWRKSFQFRFGAGGHKLNFDLHRSGGVWLWPLLITLAVTGVSMNLRSQVVEPVVSFFSPLTPSPLDADRRGAPREPRISREVAIERARAVAPLRGIALPPGGIFYAPTAGVFGVGFFEAGGDEHGSAGLGSPFLFIDGADGSALGAEIPGRGSAGDRFMQVQFPLHSGRILGTPGRVLMSVLGLAVAILSVTGVLIWARKRRARRRVAARANPSVAQLELAERNGREHADQLVSDPQD
jgi:uncharacterized iron-regulated membrane protein